MSSNDTAGSGARSNNPKPADDVSAQIESLRFELQTLKSSIAKAARGQVDATRENLEGRIRQDPLVAVAIAAGVGFLYALIRR